MKARGPGQSALLLLDVAAVLTDQAIDYVVIGAMAASFHGSIRATTDADALVTSGDAIVQGAGDLAFKEGACAAAAADAALLAAADIKVSVSFSVQVSASASASAGAQ